MKEGSDEDPPVTVPSGDKLIGDIRSRWLWTERSVWTERMLEALERGPKNGVWHSLIDKVYAPRTLAAAWEQVEANGGAGGVDRVTVERFGQDAVKELEEISRQLRENRYQPLPVRRVWIPKPGSSEQRPLGIPAVRDRVVQTAVRMVLEPIYERDFAPVSFGFRPGRGCPEALARVEQLLAEGYLHVVDADIKSYFDTIPHEALMERVRSKVVDSRVLALVEAFLKQGVLEEMKEWQETKQGTPQGAVISPLLANLYLDALDWKMHLSGWEMVRYADDFVVLTRSAEQADEVLQEIRDWCEKAGLQLHPEKTRLVDMSGEDRGGFDFLGYHFERNGGRWPREKSMRKMRLKMHDLTPRNYGDSLSELIAEKLNPSLRGWYGYFRRCNRGTFQEIDRYVRVRLRSILRKRQGGRGHGRGADHQKWPNAYFDKLGLLCLERLHLGACTVPRGGTHQLESRMR